MKMMKKKRKQYAHFVVTLSLTGFLITNKYKYKYKIKE